MSRLDDLFVELRSKNQTAFMPFVTAGDPDLEFTKTLIKELADCGCHLCEVGIPYSDPIADGPTIQASYSRALDAGVNLRGIFAAITSLTNELTMPLVCMVSYSIVLRVGPEVFVQRAQQAGFCGAIIPDLPVEESTEISRLCRDADFSLIQLVTPATPVERALRIAETSTGFLYYVSVTGITGERKDLAPQLAEDVSRLREKVDLPVCIGFGIHRPVDVERLAPSADGLIVGSAIVKHLAAVDESNRQHVVETVGEFVKSMVAALRN